jgi:hypothetical protein
MKLKLFATGFVIAFSNVIFSQIVINEGCNKNYSILTDEDGDYEDWIELYNAGSTTLNLNGYFLTDNISNPTKWVLPNLQMMPGDYEIIYCSSKDRYATQGFTNVLNSGPFVPTTGWNTHNFTTPFNWDGVSNVVIDICSYSSTGYITNSVFNQTATPYVSTTAAWNDGSPASCSAVNGTTYSQRPNIQLNGQQIGSGTIQNSPYDYPAPYGNWYWSSRTQMIIPASELTAAGLTAGNINSLAFDVAWTDPVMYDYIEINMNHTVQTEMNAAFIPNSGNLNHTNFNIDGDGETVYLLTPAQTIMSSLLVNTAGYNDSYGCFPDASAVKKIFDVPTPGSTNNASATYNGYLQAPVLSVNSGFFAAPFSVAISNPNALPSTIRYTLDGSDPTPASPAYSGLINITSTTIVRAKVFDSDSLPSPTASASYFFGVSHVTPIISVISDDANIFGASGMFDNWWEDWLKPAHVEYFDSMPSHPLVFSQNAGIMVDGGAGGSRSQPQHSFRVEWANGVLGGDPITHEIIPDRAGRMEFNTFYLRNGSNQFLNFPQKDAMQVRMMCEQTKTYYSTWRPVSVYINGDYFGLYELREKYDPQMFEFQDGADPSTIEMVGLSYWYGLVLHATEGDVDNFWNSYNSFLTVDPASPTFIDDANQYFDMEYYTDYIISESWMGNTDWPQNNIKAYRSDATNYAWRFCTIDLELSLQPNGWTDCYTDMISYMQGQSTSLPYINIWLQAMQNDEYKNYFINRYADIMNTAYLTDRLLDVEQGIFNQAYPEMANEYQRWGTSDITGQMLDYYNRHIQFRSELICRGPQVRDDIQNGFSLPQQVDVTLDVFPAGAGKIKISTITPDVYPWNGIYFDGVPIQIEAIHNPGWLFDHWGTEPLITNSLNDTFLDTLSNSSANFTAYFVEDLSAINGTNNSEFIVYPSPANSEIYLVNRNGSNFENSLFQIVDIHGNIIQEGQLDNTSDRQIIQVDQLSDGIYFVRILSDAAPVNLRFVKQ